MELFWEQGLSAVSVSGLAAAMSLQRSSFYNAFGSRDAVFLEALERYAAVSPDAALDHLPPDAPVVPALVGLLRTVCRVRAADPRARGCLVCNTLADLDGASKDVATRLTASLARRAIVVHQLMQRAVARGELPAAYDTGAAAQAFVTFLVGLNTTSRVVRSEAALWAGCAAFLRGLGLNPDGVTPDGRRPRRGRHGE